MACALTQGFSIDCRDGIGGIKEVYFIETSAVSGVTEASGVVTAITKAAGKRFWKYSLIRETSTFGEAITGNEQNGTIYYAQTGAVILNKRQAAIRNEIMILARTNVTAVVVENTGKAFLYGREFGLSLLTGDAAAGTAWADRNGYTLNFTGNEKELAPEVQTSVLATLEVAS